LELAVAAVLPLVVVAEAMEAMVLTQHLILIPQLVEDLAILQMAVQEVLAAVLMDILMVNIAAVLEIHHLHLHHRVTMGD
jgi:hypothetical protein